MALSSTWRLAWRNLGRNRKRSLLACGAIGLGQFAFLASAAIMHGYGEQYLNSITGPLVGHVQIHAEGWRQERAVERTLDGLSAKLAAIRQQPLVARAAPRIYSPVLAALDQEAFMGVVVGVDVQEEMAASGLLAGIDVGTQLGNGQVLVGRGYARQRDINVGMELAVIGQDVDGSIASELYSVSGIIASPVAIVNSAGIVMTLADAAELLQIDDAAHEIIVYLRDAEQVGAAAEGLAALDVLAGLKVEPWYEVVPQFSGIVEMMDIYTLFVLVIVFLAAAAGIANTMLMSTFERKRELGMLLALGCGPGRLARMVAAEAVVLGLIGVVFGTALGLVFAGLTTGSGFDFVALAGEESFEVGYQGLQVSSRVYPQLRLDDVIAGVGAVLLTAFISCAWPMLHIARLEPVEAMRL